jgi:sugar phosphate isomerase/epimerase
VAEPTVEELWDQWFDGQFELCKRIDNAVHGLSGGYRGANTAAVRAALYASVLEHCGEAIRAEIRLAQTPADGPGSEG